MGYGWSGTQAHNTEYPRSYSEAAQYLAGARGDKTARKLPGTATEVRRVAVYGYVGESWEQIDTAYAVRYHDTDVITWYDDGSFVLATGGYDTPTTAIKINACLPHGYRVASYGRVLKVNGADKADGYIAHPTAAQWAEDARYWQEGRDAIAARAEYEARQRAEYEAQGALPHMGEVYERVGTFAEPESKLVLSAGPFPTRAEAYAWAFGQARALAGNPTWGYINPYQVGEFWTRAILASEARNAVAS